MRASLVLSVLACAAGTAPAMAQARITSVQPIRIELVRGSAPQTLILNGSNLDALSDVRINHRGAVVQGVTAQFPPGRSLERRELRLSVAAGVRVPLGEPLDVTFGSAARGSDTSLPQNFTLLVLGAIGADDGVLAGAINSVISTGSLAFENCVDGPVGGSQPGLQLSLLPAGYTGSVMGGRSWPPYTHVLTPPERQSTQDMHTGRVRSGTRVPGTSELQQLSEHPSPIAHTLEEVRLCLRLDGGAGHWVAEGVTESGGRLEAVVRVPLAPLRFRVQGRPVDADGASDPAIGWNHPVAEAELPDLEYSGASIVVRLPLVGGDGPIRYETPQVALEAGAPGWTDAFLGPASLRIELESAPAPVLQAIVQSVSRMFNAAATRTAISNAIEASLQQIGGVEVLGTRRVDGELVFVYR